MRISSVSPAILIYDIQLLLIKFKILFKIISNELIDFNQLDSTIIIIIIIVVDDFSIHFTKAGLLSYSLIRSIIDNENLAVHLHASLINYLNYR